MGNNNSCCSFTSTHQPERNTNNLPGSTLQCDVSVSNLQHISEREGDDGDADPSQDPMAKTLFMERSKVSLENGLNRRRSQHFGVHTYVRPLKKSSSCSTIFLDGSTVSQPNLKNTVKCVALAIYYHIKNRVSERRIDIFDEKLHPLTRDMVSEDYDKYNPDHKQIYKFVRTLFNSAQLTAECAIITLVYLERLLTYAELDIAPSNWKRIVLGELILMRFDILDRTSYEKHFVKPCKGIICEASSNF